MGVSPGFRRDEPFLALSKSRMNKRNLAKELIEGLEEIRAWKRGELKLKTRTVELPRAADVPEIRKALGYSQEEFASLMGVSVGTLRNWEQARREPHGPARSLLLVASTNPAAVRGAFAKLARVQRKRRAVRQRVQ
jgi:putative transcriptional regulator